MGLIHHIIASIAGTALGTQPFVYTDDLSRPFTIGNETTDERELIRLAFATIGIDIEFSGKGLHEKGVVIDMDEDIIRQYQLNVGHLKFGQTVVRIASNTGLLPSVQLDNAATSPIDTNKSLDDLIRAEVFSVLERSRNSIRSDS